MVKREGFFNRFYSVELRIGGNSETGTGQTQLTKNPVAGLFGTVTTDPDYTYVLDPYQEGRYVTLQKVSDNYLAISEVYVSQMV